MINEVIVAQSLFSGAINLIATTKICPAEEITDEYT
jgi:hypothetical protein